MKKIPPKTVLPKPGPGTTRIIGYGGPITRKVLQWPFYLSYNYVRKITGENRIFCK